jgi:hypothetical protein
MSDRTRLPKEDSGVPQLPCSCCLIRSLRDQSIITFVCITPSVYLISDVMAHVRICNNTYNWHVLLYTTISIVIIIIIIIITIMLCSTVLCTMT